MTITTTVWLTHEEAKKYGITDESMKDLGYFKKSYNSRGKSYEKIEWSIAKEDIP